MGLHFFSAAFSALLAGLVVHCIAMGVGWRFMGEMTYMVH
jgi:hypothetical protein